MKAVHPSFRSAVWLIAASLLFAAMLFGQATDGIIVGAVSDSTGAAVPGAAITALNKATGVKYTAETNTSGEYRLNNVPIGTYDVSATAKGFATATTGNVVLELNHTSSVNLTLAVGTLSTSVEVTESAAMIDTSTSQLQSTFDAMEAIDVPTASFSKVINGAGIYNLSLLGAGVASSGGVGQGTGPSIAGQRPENNSFNIDGVMNDAHYTTGPMMYVSNDAIAEFNLVQNQFSPEFGGASGGVFNSVVKSGTNEIHGSVYEYMQNRKLNAVDAQETQQGIYSNPRFDSNRLGASIGGPVIKNKLFYYGDFEYNPLGQTANPSQTVTAPTAAGLTTLNGMAGLNKTNLGVFEQYVPVAATANAGTTLVNSVAIPLGNLSFASPNYTNSYNAVAAVDYDMSNRDQFRARFLYNNSTGIDAVANVPVFFAPNPNISKSGSISEFHNFNATTENELRVAFTRNFNSIQAGNFTFPGLSMFPNLAFDDLSLQLGPDPNTPSGQIENDAQLQESLTKTWGRHTFKAGFQMTDTILSGYFVQRVRGDYDYANLGQYLLDQQPTGGNLSGVDGERDAGLPDVPYGFLQSAGYFNDDFRVTRNLTLNLGLRYEYVTVPVGSRYQAQDAVASVPGVITFANPKPDKNDWAPRIGFAWSPGTGGVWSVRGGVSRAYDNTYINLNQNASPPYFATTVDVNDANPVTNGFLAHGGCPAECGGVASGPLTAATARANTSSYTFDYTRPYALTGSIGVQRMLKKDYTVEARYVHTKGVHLWNQTRMNILDQVTPTNYIPTYLSMPSSAVLAADTKTLGGVESYLAPGTTAQFPHNDLAIYGFQNNIVGYHPWGNSKYDGLALQMTKRYSKNFSYILAYTWSHNLDDSTATNFSTILSPRRAQDFQNMRAEWASSALDRRQRLTITPVYDFRPFSNGKYLMKNVVGNWNVSLTYTYQAPEFATVQSGVDSNLNGDNAGDRSIINPSGAVAVGSGVTGYSAAGLPLAAGSAGIVAYVANNPNARYVVAGVGAMANAGRNTLPLDPINNIDFALTKRLNFGEKKAFTVGAQMFNLFNHPQFTGGYLSDVSSFGTNAVSRNFLTPNNVNFGEYQKYFPSNARSMQLTAHFIF
jgi:hypothetical protein